MILSFQTNKFWANSATPNQDCSGCNDNDGIELCVSNLIDVLDNVSTLLFTKKISNLSNTSEEMRKIQGG